MQDIGASSNVAGNRRHPLGPLLCAMSCMHCMPVSPAQGGLGLDYRRDRLARDEAQAPGS